MSGFKNVMLSDDYCRANIKTDKLLFSSPYMLFMGTSTTYFYALPFWRLSTSFVVAL